MNRRISRTILLAALLALGAFALAGTASAADTGKDKAAHRNIVSEWVIWPMRGHEQQFEEALRKHAAWRKSAGENLRWHIYQPVVGDNLDFYVIRSNHAGWSDFDTQEDWGREHGAGMHYRTDVAPHARREAHFFSVTDTKLSHWKEDKTYRLFAVYSYGVKAGQRETVRKVLSRIHKAVTDAKWPHSYGIDYEIGGRGGLYIVVPMKNWAGMAEPDPSLMKVMAKAMGSEKAAKGLMHEFAKATERRGMTVFAYRKDLSTPD